ncbi:MAG: HAD family hydrolase [Planctomycetota bacterium]
MQHATLLAAAALLTACAATDPLPSWREGAVKTGIVDFVERVTDEGGPDFVPASERVATFDNDGTLWSEQPAYFQLLFAIDQVRAMSSDRPEFLEEEPFRSAVEANLDGVMASGKEGLLELVLASHGNTSTDEFAAIAREWIETARHPTTAKPYTRMVYQPMLELLDYLRAEGFDVFIVSGGGIEFLRVWAEEVYGVPPQNVIGSTIATTFEWNDGTPRLMRQPRIDFIDDGAGKPVAIHRHIGRRPIAAFGNSDGDLEMLQWTAAGDGPRFMALVHHTDGDREWAYDRESPVGRLRWALDEAAEQDWTVIDMARDWETVYAPARDE